MKLDTDTKVIVAGVLVLGLGVWYAQRQVKAAASGITGAVGAAWDSFAGAVGGIGSSIVSGGQSLSDSLGVSGYTDTSTGVYYPYGTVAPPPAGTAYAPWWLGGAPTSQFDAQGNYLATGINQATQADVRRVDNAIASGGSTSSFSWPWLDFSKI